MKYKAKIKGGIISAAMAAILLLSGCGAAASSVASQSSQPQASTPADTKVVSTVNGDVTIPANPQRVIVHYLMGDAIALGVTPVGVSEILPGAVFEEDLKDAVDLGSWDFEMEEVMALEPDLIISVNEGQYEDLSKIAPTVLVPYGKMTTEERVTFMAELLGKEDMAQKILDEYNDKLQQAKEKMQAAGIEETTVTILQASDNGNALAGDKHALGVLVYKELGLVPPARVQTDIIDADAYWGQPSMEVLAEYCGDVMIHLGEVQDDIKTNAVWNAIPAIKNNQIFEVDTALTYYTDITSSGVLADTVSAELVTLLAK
ncbi:MAG: ABC transporter substrate-binding protein [Oscillospiraceae bacterium]